MKMFFLKLTQLATLFCLLTNYKLKLTFAHIIRLPDCKYHANFSVQYTGSKFVGALIETSSSITLPICLQKCMVHNGCGYINFKALEGGCELIELASGANNANSDWVAYSTQYGTRWRGPLCKSLQPCTAIQSCDDICNESYQCQDEYVVHNFPDDSTDPTNYYSVDISSTSQQLVSKWKLSKATFRFDSPIYSQNAAPAWWKIHLGDGFMIGYFEICEPKITPFLEVYFGSMQDTDEFCTNKAFQHGRFDANSRKWFIVECDFLMWGKYIKWAHEPQTDQTWFSGIKVYKVQQQ